MIIFNGTERENNVQNEKVQRYTHEKIQEHETLQTHKQTIRRNTKMGEIHTNKYRQERYHKHKGLDHL